jgi:hypothetical protein
MSGRPRDTGLASPNPQWAICGHPRRAPHGQSGPGEEVLSVSEFVRRVPAFPVDSAPRGRLEPPVPVIFMQPSEALGFEELHPAPVRSYLLVVSILFTTGSCGSNHPLHN